MKVGLYIPYWGDSPSRHSAYLEVMENIHGLWPWEQVNAVGENLRHRGKARNEAMSHAAAFDIDIAVLLDADSYPEADGLASAVFGAFRYGGVHFPHDRVRAYQENGLFFEYGPSAGGCWVARPEAWFAAGGMEERGGWSVDDRTFLAQLRTFDLGPTYHSGVLTCLWHTLDPGTGVLSVPADDQALIDRYHEAQGSPEAMRKILEERP